MLFCRFHRNDGERFSAYGEFPPRSSAYVGPSRSNRLRPIIYSIVIVMLAAALAACGGAVSHDSTGQSAQSSEPKASSTGINAQSSESASSGSIPVVTQNLPVLINSAAYQQAADDGFTYAFPQTLTAQQVAALNDLPVSFQAYIAQVNRLGGTNVYDTDVQIILQGNAVGQTAVIAGINVIKKCGRPFAGTLLYSPPAAQDNDIEIGFNLDSRFPIAQDYKESKTSGNYFEEHTISLQHGVPQTLLIHAITRHYSCQFTYQLLVDTGNREVAEVISDNGKPFTVTAALKASSYDALYLGGVVSPTEDDKYEPVSPKANSTVIQAYNETVADS